MARRVQGRGRYRSVPGRRPQERARSRQETVDRQVPQDRFSNEFLPCGRRKHLPAPGPYNVRAWMQCEHVQRVRHRRLQKLADFLWNTTGPHNVSTTMVLERTCQATAAYGKAVQLHHQGPRRHQLLRACWCRRAHARPTAAEARAVPPPAPRHAPCSPPRHRETGRVCRVRAVASRWWPRRQRRPSMSTQQRHTDVSPGDHVCDCAERGWVGKRRVHVPERHRGGAGELGASSAHGTGRRSPAAGQQGRRLQSGTSANRPPPAAWWPCPCQLCGRTPTLPSSEHGEL